MTDVSQATWPSGGGIGWNWTTGINLSGGSRISAQGGDLEVLDVEVTGVELTSEAVGLNSKPTLRWHRLQKVDAHMERLVLQGHNECRKRTEIRLSPLWSQRSDGEISPRTPGL